MRAQGNKRERGGDMRITDQGPTDINADRLSRTNNPAATTQPKPHQAKQSDDATRVSISAAGRQQAEAATQSAPSQRAETIRNIREQIEAGTYQVDSKEVAQSILNSKDAAYIAGSRNKQG